MPDPVSVYLEVRPLVDCLDLKKKKKKKRPSFKDSRLGLQDKAGAAQLRSMGWRLEKETEKNPGGSRVGRIAFNIHTEPWLQLLIS